LRAKLIIILIVYCAGFGTAVYMMQPTPTDNKAINIDQKVQMGSVTSQKFLDAVNINMHKCFDLCKKASVQTGKLIKEKLDERKTQK
jgi:hypothetical protein